MNYITIAKYAGIVIVFVSWNAGVYRFGVANERSAWIISTQKKAIEAASKLQELTTKIMVEESKSAELANKLEVVKNENQSKINAIRADLVTAGKRLQRKQVCRGSGIVTSTKDSSPGVVVEETANQAELSREFEEFIISDAYRADSVGLYADTAYNWIVELCKDKSRFICD